MTTCPNCGTQNLDGVRFCVQCGAQLAPPAGSWRGDEGTGSGFGDPRPPAPAPGAQTPPTSSGAGGYVPPPPYAAPPPPSFAAPPPPDFGAPLPAMSYATHGAGGYGAPMQYASWGRRVVGSILDGLVSFGVMLVIAIPFGILSALFSGGGDPNSFGAFGCLGGGLFYLAGIAFTLYNQIYLRSTRGSTLGQGWMNMKTVTAEGANAPLGTIIIRFLVTVGLGFIPCIGQLLDNLFPLWDEKRQTIHDKAAGTFVIET